MDKIKFVDEIGDFSSREIESLESLSIDQEFLDARDALEGCFKTVKQTPTVEMKTSEMGVDNG